MATKVSTGVTLTSDFFMNNFYSENRKAAKSATRKNYSEKELSYEDSRALKKAASKLKSYDFTDSENIENIYSTVSAFVDTYNNALTSSGKCGDKDINEMSSKLKKLVEKYSDKLAKIGITSGEGGTMTVNSEIFKKCDVDKIHDVFSKDETDLLKTTEKLAKKLKDNTRTSIYQDITGTGKHISISL